MSRPLESAIYQGQVSHQRFLPIKHRFDYQLFMMYLDLDELDSVFKDRWLWSTKGKNIAYLKREDHLGPATQSIKSAVKDLVYQRIGKELHGPIRLMTHLRYWGYCFNPVSFYFCFSPDQKLEVIVAEINNTPWGEQHCYVLAIDGQRDQHSSLIETKHGLAKQAHRYHFEFQKEFHISPLLSMDMRHDCWFSEPQQTLNIHMNNFKDQQKWFTAHLSLTRQEISAQNLRKILLKFPSMTAKVISAIYWQALRTWLKGAKVHPHP